MGNEVGKIPAENQEVGARVMRRARERESARLYFYGRCLSSSVG
jgi:hypothetical protein